jgi:hypothetical protein
VKRGSRHEDEVEMMSRAGPTKLVCPAFYFSPSTPFSFLPFHLSTFFLFPFFYLSSSVSSSFFLFYLSFYSLLFFPIWLRTIVMATADMAPPRTGSGANPSTPEVQESDNETMNAHYGGDCKTISCVHCAPSLAKRFDNCDRQGIDQKRRTDLYTCHSPS